MNIGLFEHLHMLSECAVEYSEYPLVFLDEFVSFALHLLYFGIF